MKRFLNTVYGDEIKWFRSLTNQKKAALFIMCVHLCLFILFASSGCLPLYALAVLNLIEIRRLYRFIPKDKLNE